MRGFTLIEMLVVVLIIGVVSALAAAATVPGRAALAEKEARRLAALLELAYTEAHASGQAIAWQPAGDRYAFLRRSENGEWAPFPQTSIYRPRSLGEGLHLKAEPLTIFPYGLGAPFEATLAGGERPIILQGNLLGRVALQRLYPG